jgi:hypothetical protein
LASLKKLLAARSFLTMNWVRFLFFLTLGVAIVLAQAVASWFDGYLTQAQMHSRGIAHGWSFLEHGGMWGDAFIISPLLAYILSKYRLAYFSKASVFVLIAVTLAALAMGYAYQRTGMTSPEAHTHDGATTLAGLIHGVFAIFAIWTCSLVYLDLTSPPVAKSDVIAFSLLLTPFFVLGVTKLSQHWSFGTLAIWQVAIEIALLWAVTAGRLWSARAVVRARLGETARNA